MSRIVSTPKSYLALFVCLLVAFAGCKQAPKAEKKAFVKVKDAAFVIDGETYQYVGTNMWYGAYLGQAGENGNRDRLIKELDILQEHGIDNLRVLGSSEDASFKHMVRPTFINKDGSINPDLLVGLDFLLAEMAKRDMKAVIYVNNYWEWSGGMSGYNERFGLGEATDPGTTGDWAAFMRYSARFYKNAEANSAYQAYIKQLVERKNSVTGEVYKNDPTIMAWQLANEPRPGVGEEAKEDIPVYIEWIDKTAGFIKSIDPNHLVSTGSEGEMGSLDSIDTYREAHKTANIDYLTFHIWAKNWSWIDPNDMEGTYDNAIKNATAYINKHIEVAQELGKPLVLEEFGFPRDGETYEKDTPTSFRDKYYSFIYNQIEQKPAFAGSNFWAWGGVAEAAHEDFVWQEGDDFMGDPPQEPQGLNSVFANDSTTMAIIKEHAKALKNQATYKK